MALKRLAISGASVLGLIAVGYALHGAAVGTQSAIHGLTLAAMVFLVASGLSLIFGLMNVLNLSHGAIFMVGAYVAAVASSRPAMLSLVLAFPLVFTAGVLIGGYVGRLMPGLRRYFPVWAARTFAAFAFAVAGAVWVSSSPSSLVPAPFSAFQLGPVTGTASTFVLAGLGAWILALSSQSSSKTVRTVPKIGLLCLVAGMSLALFADAIGSLLEALPSSAVFIVAVAVATGVGIGIGGAMEAGLLRRLYSRHLTQVIMTFFLLIFMTQAVQVLFGRNTISMSRPDMFNRSVPACTDAGLMTALLNGCASFTLGGAQTATYRIVIVAGAVAVFVLITVVLRLTKTGMYIRAGVQNSEMVGALGINVEQVFKRTFMLGSAVAAFGGAISGPFLGASPSMALLFLVDATVVLLIGGLGSLAGAVLGSLVFGLWTALSDVTVLSVGLDPSITRISVLLLFIAILMLRPQGLFEKVKS